MRLAELRAAAILWRQRMPAGEIRAVFAAGDPATVRRYLALHGERLGEWLAAQQRVLESVEGWLVAKPVAPGYRRAVEGAGRSVGAAGGSLTACRPRALGGRTEWRRHRGWRPSVRPSDFPDALARARPGPSEPRLCLPGS